MWSKGHFKPEQLKRGWAPDCEPPLALLPPAVGVIVKARYTRMAGAGMGAARAHLRYIQRDGVTRDGDRGQLYGAKHDDINGGAFLERSTADPHQFRFIVSAEDSGLLADLKPLVRDLMRQMERALDNKLDWAAVDYFNTGHPHSHIVIRGKDDKSQDLVMARTYIGHGVRARAQDLITLQLRPETQIEKMLKLRIAVDQERLTQLDRAILGQAEDSVLGLPASACEEHDPARRALRIGRLKTLECLRLAEERQTGVWQLDQAMEPKLRQLGDRADKCGFRRMRTGIELNRYRGSAEP